MNDESKLAVAFCGILAAWLTDDEMAEVVARNKAEQNPGVCHSHDFCDANMAMLEAGVTVFGREIVDLEGGPLGDHAGVELWNEAWSIAKAADFDPSKIEGAQ